MIRTKFDRVLLTAAASVAMASIVSAVHADELPATIKVGALMPITGPGASSGASGVVGVTLAVETINKMGGIAGRKLELVLADDQTNPGQAVNEARRLVESEKVNVMIGPMISAMALSAAPVLTEANLPWVSSAGTNRLTPELAPYHFSTLASAESQGKAMVNYAKDVLKAKKVVLLADNGAQAKAAVVAIEARAADVGLEIVAKQEYEFRSADVTPQILSLRRSEPEAVLFFSNAGEDTGNVIRALQDVSWEVPVVGSITVAGLPQLPVEIAGPNAYDRVVGLQYKASTYCPGEPEGSSDYSKFLVALKAANPATYDQLAPSSSLYPYAGLFLIKEVVEKTKSLDGKTFASYVVENGPSIPNPAGKLSASATDHFVIGPGELVMVENANETRADGLQKRVGCP